MSAHARILDRPGPATLLWLAAPNIAASLIQSLLIVTDGWHAGRLGTEALAAMALVFPAFMLTMMLSAGAIGGAVAGAMARATGAGDVGRANGILRVAVVLALALGTLKGALFLATGPYLLSAMNAAAPVREAALGYVAVLFPGIALVWVTNMLASALRGTGDMVRPLQATAMIVSVHAVLSGVHVALGMPLGLVGAAWALLGGYAGGALYLLWIWLRPGRAVRLTQTGWGSLGRTARQVLAAGSLAGSQSVVTIAYSFVATAVFGGFGTVWLAGYGLGMRLELTLVPIIFGVGGAGMVITGTLVGAGRRRDAIRMGWLSAAGAGALVGLIGLVAGLWPGLWTGLFTDSPEIAAAGAEYLGRVGPFYGFFGVGLTLYFVSQGLETLFYPVLGAILRFALVALGFALLGATGHLTPETALMLGAGAMTFYGLFNAAALALGPWARATPVPPMLGRQPR